MGALAISSDGARIVTGSYFRAGGQVWNAETGAYLHLLHVWGLPAAVSADGGRIISVISEESAFKIQTMVSENHNGLFKIRLEHDYIAYC